MKRYAIGIIVCVALLLTSCSTDLWASSDTSKTDDASLEWAFTRADQHPEQVLIGVIDEATATLDVAIYSLTHPQIVAALQRAETRGVSVRILADQSQSEGQAMAEALKILGSSGADIKVNSHSGLMHLKMIVADRKIVTTGSFNFTKAAASIHDEVVMVIRNMDVSQSFAHEFDSMWKDTSAFHTIRPEVAALDTPGTATSVSDQPDTSCTTNVIKGNAESKIYHMPGQKYYDKLQEPVRFCTEAAAQAAGYRKSKA